MDLAGATADAGNIDDEGGTIGTDVICALDGPDVAFSEGRDATGERHCGLHELIAVGHEGTEASKAFHVCWLEWLAWSALNYVTDHVPSTRADHGS